MADSAKLIVEVVAGIITEQPMLEYTRRYVITSKEWTEAEVADEKEPHRQGLPAVDRRATLIIERGGQAQAYAAALMNPAILNWVRTDWIWL